MELCNIANINMQELQATYQYDNISIRVESSSDTDSLFLTPAEIDAFFSYLCLITRG